MKVAWGEGKTEYGPGVMIKMSGQNVCEAIIDWLIKQNVEISGPRTIKVNGQLINEGSIYVDPSGAVVSDGVYMSGRGKAESTQATLPENLEDIPPRQAKIPPPVANQIKRIAKKAEANIYVVNKFSYDRVIDALENALYPRITYTDDVNKMREEAADLRAQRIYMSLELLRSMIHEEV